MPLLHSARHFLVNTALNNDEKVFEESRGAAIVRWLSHICFDIVD